MTQICSNCDSEVELAVSNVRDSSRSGKGYTPSKEETTVYIVITCDCTKKKANTTELTALHFNGRPPEGWE